jgi:hypothetical protein
MLFILCPACEFDVDAIIRRGGNMVKVVGFKLHTHVGF